MSSALVLTLVLSQYTRARINDADTQSQCLWWKEATAIEFRQNVDGDAEVPGDAEFTAVAAAFATWQAELSACGSLSLTEGPRTLTRTVGYTDSGANENVVLFRARPCKGMVPETHTCWKDDVCGNQFDCWDHAEGALALTNTSYNKFTGRALDADIELNSWDFTFTTVDAPRCVAPAFSTSCVATDVQNTMTHEVGHLLGLNHYDAAVSTMNTRASAGELSKRALDPGSKRFVCDAYPKNERTPLCVLPVTSSTLGKLAKTGCAQVPPSLVAVGALALLARRRRP
ncbi:MAG: matrixin [Archangium sp.]|nr:matrixin [Archangium sp.]